MWNFLFSLQYQTPHPPDGGPLSSDASTAKHCTNDYPSLLGCHSKCTFCTSARNRVTFRYTTVSLTNLEPQEFGLLGLSIRVLSMKDVSHDNNTSSYICPKVSFEWLSDGPKYHYHKIRMILNIKKWSVPSIIH